jgi:hypothetical protein
LVTNGKSHPDAKVDPEQLRRLSDKTGGQIYVNTLVPIEDNSFEEKCDACDYNEPLFVQQAGFSQNQIISKDLLDSRVPDILSSLCPLNQVVERECNDCTCTCESFVGQQGAIGYQGNKGENGGNGRQGVDGAPGVDGFAGVDGPNGADGCDGASGSPGTHGRPGSEGVSGRSGLVGVTGPRGPAGGRGSGSGNKGLPGFPGQMGAQGEAGVDGLNGMDGPMGRPGLAGAEGDSGISGERGEKGQNGQHGLAGQDGEPGFPGPVIPGMPGQPGETGPKGPKGQRGPNGADGVQGQQGFCGKVGKNGPKGVVGMPGATGPRGGIKMDNSQVESKIRNGVRSILDKLLPENNMNRVCGGNCQSYADYAETMYNQIIAITTQTEAARPPTRAPVTYEPEVTTQEVVETTEYVTRRPATHRPATRRPATHRPVTRRTTTEALPEVTEGDDEDDYNNYWNDLDDDEDSEVEPVTHSVTERPAGHGAAGAVDLVFMIETSDYMLNLDWELVTSWVKRVITVAKSDPSKNVRSAIVVIRFNQSRHTMAAMLENKINEMKAVLQEDAVVQHIVSDPFEALEFANNNVYNKLRHGSKRVLITITDGTHRDMNDVSDANVQILADTMTKYPVMIAIGLGSDVDAKSLAPFASHEDKIFVDVTAEQLMDITQAVLAEVEFHDEPSK